MQRSISLNKIPASNIHKINRQRSNLGLQSYRLNFPIVGDTHLYQNYGKKHFDNHSDKMGKIILPFKYISQKSYQYPRQQGEAVYHPPHLIKQNQNYSKSIQKTSKRQYQAFGYESNLYVRPKESRHGERVITQPTTTSVKPQNYMKLGQNNKKYDDELDKLQKYLDLKKNTPNPEANVKVADSAIPNAIEKHINTIEENKLTPKDSNANKISSLSINPVYSPITPSKIQQFKANNRQKYDITLSIRSRNPTHLSTGLSII